VPTLVVGSQKAQKPYTTLKLPYVIRTITVQPFYSFKT